MSGETVSPRASVDETGPGSAINDIQLASAEALMPRELSVGQQLRVAREARGLAVADIAKKLKLSPRQVEALESDDWSRLPCNTIVRGFVRNYARLIDLNPDLLMVSLDRLHMPQLPDLEMPIGTNVSLPQAGKVARRDYVRVFSGLILLVLAVLAYFFFSHDMWQSTLSALKSAAQFREPAVESVVPPTIEEARTPDTSVSLPSTAVLPEVSALPAQSLPLTTPASLPVSMPTTSSGNGLKFSFTQPSWVEVRDRSGEIIFSQLSQAGSQREIEGRPPFVLVIGNATHVSLRYKGKPVDLSRRSKDDVARVTVE
jgi:cytoskeleton protein RodZ